jgi:hypothetical protein
MGQSPSAWQTGGESPTPLSLDPLIEIAVSGPPPVVDEFAGKLVDVVMLGVVSG